MTTNDRAAELLGIPRELITLIVWVALTATIEVLFFIGYAVYEQGTGPYSCSYFDSITNCGLMDVVLNRILMFNLILGIPTIFAGAIAWVIVKVWRQGITPRKPVQ